MPAPQTLSFPDLLEATIPHFANPPHLSEYGRNIFGGTMDEEEIDAEVAKAIGHLNELNLAIQRLYDSAPPQEPYLRPLSKMMVIARAARHGMDAHLGKKTSLPDPEGAPEGWTNAIVSVFDRLNSIRTVSHLLGIAREEWGDILIEMATQARVDSRGQVQSCGRRDDETNPPSANQDTPKKDELTDTDLEILEAVPSDGVRSQNEIADKSGAPIGTVKNTTPKLRRLGLIRRTTVTESGRSKKGFQKSSKSPGSSMT